MTMQLVPLLILAAALMSSSLQVWHLKRTSLMNLHLARPYGAEGCNANAVSNYAGPLYCEAQAVEVIPPEKDGDNMKVILKIPPPKVIKKYIMEDLPQKLKGSIDNVLSANGIGITKQTVVSFLAKLKNLVSGNGFTDKADTDFSSKALAGLGLNALLAYGFVSNVSYITCLVLSWLSFSGNTQMSPLAPGQWKPFLGIYAGYWAINNVLRPLRFSLSLVLMPYFNKMIDYVQGKTKYGRKISTGIVVFAVNFCGTITYMTLGIAIASMITGAPIW